MKGEFTKEEAHRARVELDTLFSALHMLADYEDPYETIRDFIVAAWECAPTEASLTASRENQALVEQYKEAKARVGDTEEVAKLREKILTRAERTMDLILEAKEQADES